MKKYFNYILAILLGIAFCISCSVENSDDGEDNDNNSNTLNLTYSNGYKEDKEIKEITATYDTTNSRYKRFSIKIDFVEMVWSNYLNFTIIADLDTLTLNKPIQHSDFYVKHEQSNEIHWGRSYYVKSGNLICTYYNKEKIKLQFQDLEIWYEADSFSGDCTSHRFDVSINGSADVYYEVINNK